MLVIRPRPADASVSEAVVGKIRPTLSVVVSAWSPSTLWEARAVGSYHRCRVTLLLEAVGAVIGGVVLLGFEDV